MQNRILYHTIFFLLAFLLSAHSKAQKNDIAARIIVIGDAGRLHGDKNAVVDAVKDYVSPSDKNTTIVFAGDNIYPKGLPGKEDRNYNSAEHILVTLLSPFKDYKAKVYVIPGNHDWQKSGPYGWERIKNQAQLVKELAYPNTVFLPEGGCPGPEEVAINDSLVMIIFDTQWWLHKNDKPGIDDDCECKTEDEVLTKLRDIAYRNRGKRILFASHHPLRTYGEHGGYYTWKQHIFPFTDLNKNAWVPLPVIGSIYPIVRGKFGNVEDIMHPIYKDMIQGIEAALAEVPDVTYIGGHDHNMQLIIDESRTNVISGSGTNRSRVKQGKKSLFASDKNGFAEVIYTKEGTKTVNYYEVDNSAAKTLVYAYNAPYIAVAKAQKQSPAKELLADSITVTIAPKYDDVNGFHRLMLGEHYRKIWATPVTVKVLHINKEKGGLKVLKKGGGQQTKSLRLEDKNGKQWVIRTIQKNPERALPSNLRATVAKTIVQDQTSAANPFAPLTVPALATAAGVPHTDPQIVFVPDDPALGIYRGDFANTVCIFEEREPGTEETYSTQKVLDKLEEDNDNTVNQQAVLRARMLDLLIGDWDRHEDQWRWSKMQDGKKSIYSPIPRDRDQVYYINTGVIPYIAGRSWIMPKLQGFGGRVGNVNGFMFNARYFDRMFLNRLDKRDWQQVIAGVQSSVTDEVITNAVKQFPDSVYKQIGPRIIKNLISRRDHLMQYGMKYYAFLARSVDIPASDKKDILNVQTNKDGDVNIVLQKVKKDGTAGDVYYERTLSAKGTKEIRLYGRGGADEFIIDGARRPGVKIRMIGGGGDDSFYVGRSARARSKLLIYDRTDKNNSFPQQGAHLLTSHKDEVNEYNPRSFRYNKLAPLATAGYNLDDGILLGIGAVYTQQGFRREPYADKHRIMIGRALKTDAAFVKYKGDITNVIGKVGLDMHLNVFAPDNTVNFFGIGNETRFDKISDPSIRYYRTRYNLIDGQARLKYAVGKSFNVFAGLAGQYFNMDASDNTFRYINVYETDHKIDNLFEHKAFAGAVAGYEIDTRNDGIQPIRGFHWRTSITGMQQINSTNTYGQLRTEMSVHLSFNRNPRVVIADRIGAGVSLGDPQFFQLFYLGGEGGLQGFRKNRFAGNKVLYNNLELRIKLFDFASYLFPGTIGLIGFNDVGRVWAKNEISHKWHTGYGGGLYIIPAESIVVSALAGFSEEGVLPYIGLGFRF